MAQVIRGIGLRRTAIALAVAAAMFSASSLMPGEPAAQTVSSNGKIVYVGSDGVNNDIFTINADGSEVSQLTTDGRSNDNPEWSPDGTKIAFDSWVDANTSNIYVMNANGTGRQHLTTTSPSQGGDFQATWAPDGGWLAFVSTRDGNSELYRMNANGSAQTRLTVEPAADKQPSISPEGRIAFASDRANADYEAFDLYVLDPEIGREPTRLTFDGDPDENFFRHDSLNPVWSPDGTRIAFDSTRSGNREVWVINADGSGLTNVSDDPAQDYEPAWSPDGSQITFTSSRAGDLDIWAVDAPPTTAASFSALEVGTDSALAASEPRNLTPGDGLNAVSPDWGAAPTCTIQGSPGADTLTGTSRADVICSLGGNDTVEGAGGQDIIKGGLGDDTLKGQGANDRLVGGGGADGLFGGTGDDTLNSKDGVSGNDSLSGGTHVNGDKKVTDATEKSIVGFP